MGEGETAFAALWRRAAFQSEKYRESMAKSYTFLYLKKVTALAAPLMGPLLAVTYLCMAIFFENLFNIITERKETVYTFGEICNKFEVPAKKEEWSVDPWLYFAISSLMIYRSMWGRFLAPIM
ncbi:hypothetical protein ABEW34_11290 [Paenibacillus algorifonticola]|uniref:hypothetical protein n=1 Tax=Paenibacillus algorifonticola TaxID=684063 RepID=UPI003D2CCA34